VAVEANEDDIEERNQVEVPNINKNNDSCK
jgi:hypothetical protein